METVYQVSFLVSPVSSASRWQEAEPSVHVSRGVCFEVCVRRAGARAFLAGGPRAADLAVGAKGARESRGSWEGRWGLPKWWWRPAELQSDVQEGLPFL